MPNPRGYVLEVARFDRSGFAHVGYVDKLFSTKKSAAEYYNRNNPHMRHLSTNGMWGSDWDTVTKLKYIVRDNEGIHCNIPPPW